MIAWRCAATLFMSSRYIVTWFATVASSAISTAVMLCLCAQSLAVQHLCTVSDWTMQLYVHQTHVATLSMACSQLAVAKAIDVL
jgi:hypothetical protein